MLNHFNYTVAMSLNKFHVFIELFNLKHMKPNQLQFGIWEGWRKNKVDKTLAMQVADLHLIPGTLYGSMSLPRVIPECFGLGISPKFCRFGLQNKTKQIVFFLSYFNIWRSKRYHGD